MSKVLFRGARLIDPASVTEGGTDRVTDVLVEDGRISEVGIKISASGAEVVSADGAVLAPGFVDMHVHLREPGREDEETIATGSEGAVLGGFTAIMAMPNTDPVCDSAAIAEKVAAQGRLVGLVEVLPAGSLTRGLEGKTLSPIGEMVRSSASVRMFTDDGKGVQDSRLLRRAMEYIKGFGAICAEHCEDAALAEGGHMNESEFSDALGLKGIPAEAEEIALARDLALARLTGVRFHALHVSTEGAAALIRESKAKGLRVTAEVTPHHLTLMDSDLLTYDPNFKVNPPLRSGNDVEALRKALAEGVFDAIATDHAPHSPEEKEAEFELAPSGMLGLQTALSVVLTEIVGAGVIDLVQMVRLMSTSPAAILGLEDQGGPITVGSVANLVVFDPDAQWTVDPYAMASPSRNTPWAGRTLRGKVLHTMSAGRLVVRDGALAGESVGAAV